MNPIKIKVAVLGAGNVGVAISADLSLLGHEVYLIKTSSRSSQVFDLIKANENRVALKENGKFAPVTIADVSDDLGNIEKCDVIFITVQSTYHDVLIQRISKYLNRTQIVVCVCSYLSSLYFQKYCPFMPAIIETTGPYLEGRIDLNDNPGEVTFRVGCRLSKSPMSVFESEDEDYCMTILTELYSGFSVDYTPIESALLNPNMVLHTVGAIMSIPRIEYSEGDFCMYREAYTRKNEATMKIMLGLDDEKKAVLSKLGCSQVDIFKAGGFLGDPMESFFRYSESPNRAISPTSVYSRYITEDVSQGLVLLESIAKHIGVSVPITSSLITIASHALEIDFRSVGRTIEKLNAEEYINNCNQKS